MSDELPEPDGPRIRDTEIRHEDLLVLPRGTTLTRVHTLGGPFSIQWDEIRRFGPTRSRFDPHLEPRRPQRRGVAYLTYDLDEPKHAFTTAIAEVFQDDAGRVGPIDPNRAHLQVTVFDSAREITLLNMASGWVTRAGGNQAIWAGAKSMTQRWARFIWAYHRGSFDAIAYPSSVWGPGRCIALWDRGADIFPAGPAASRSLSDPALSVPVASVADELKAPLVP